MSSARLTCSYRFYQQFLYQLVDEQLDHSATRTHQKLEKIHVIYDKVCSSRRHIYKSEAHSHPQAMLQFPSLSNIGPPYDIWVIKDFISLRLKQLQNGSNSKVGRGKKGRTARR
jgi:hypothetical protein